MKILIISTSDIGGGAAIAAYRLHEGLRNVGADSQMLVVHKQSDDERVIRPSKLQRGMNFMYWQGERAFTSLSAKHRQRNVPFSNGLFSFQLQKRIQEINPDIINLHWVCDAFVSIHSLSQLQVPIVWSMHDMWPITGGCHYDQGCAKFTSTCEKCPVLGPSTRVDLSKKVFDRKRKVYARKDITFVGSSNWLADCARKSALARDQRVEVIHPGLNLSTFKPIERAIARDILNLPLDKRIILFGSLHGEIDKRKGFAHIFPALDAIKHIDAELVVFGQSQSFHWPDTALPIRYLGKFKDSQSLALLYAAADVLLFPSLQENFGNICMESLACGTPIVAFGIGGNPDMILHKKNGYLAPAYDAQQLGEGLSWVLEYPNRVHDLSLSARKRAEELLDQNRMAQEYLELFQSFYPQKEERLPFRTTPQQV
ncbi:MAG: glycosyltransferase family 4 protein [Bacteroidota bacterium]